MERAVICAALIDPEGFTRVIDQLSAEHFYDRRHQLIYAAMGRLFGRGSPIDALTVSEELERSGDLDSVGGDPYLAELSNEVATAAHAEYYAKSIRERCALRQLINTGSRMVDEAYEAIDVAELLDRTMQKIFDISSGRQRGGFLPMNLVLTSVHEMLDRFHESRTKLTGVGTGFTKLDDLTSGFQRGDFIVIAGRPSMGKTAFSLDLARNAALKYRTPVAFFSLEMGAQAIALRLLGSQARINYHRVRTGKLPERDWKKLSLATGDLSEMPFFIDDSSDLGILELRARARRMKQQHNIGIVFLDYMQLLKPPRADNREQEVAQISRALKALARDLDIPVVAMSQLSRAVEHRGGDKRPQLADLRDSGAIEQDADLVMFIYRELTSKGASSEDGKKASGNGAHTPPERDDAGGEAEIIVRKQRNGPTGEVKLTFLPAYARFENKADEDDLPVGVVDSPFADEGETPF